MSPKVFCLNCKPVYRKSKPDQRVGVVMDGQVLHFFGDSVDEYNCPECGKDFQVSYKVDEITPI